MSALKGRTNVIYKRIFSALDQKKEEDKKIHSTCQLQKEDPMSTCN